MRRTIVLTVAFFAVCGFSMMSAQHLQPKISGAAGFPHDSVMTKTFQSTMTPQQALQRLIEGNNRFLAGKNLQRNYLEAVHQTYKGQYPYAFILSCIDSRTSPEIIFDQNLGDVFNARIAGNFVNNDILGSMEFACKVAGAKLIVVIGHTKCGAVKGACDHVQLGNLTSVINEISPAVEMVKDVSGKRSSENDVFVEAVAHENVRLAIEEIRDKSPILLEMESKGELLIVGGMYDLKTGKVEFTVK